MGAAIKQKNVVKERSKVKANRDVNIGDKTTINVYGFEASKSDIKFGIKLTGSLIIMFGLATIWALLVADPDKFWKAHLAGFAAGAFTALVMLVFVFLIKLSLNSTNLKHVTDEIQNSN